MQEMSWWFRQEMSWWFRQEMSWCWMIAIHVSENVRDGMTIQLGVNSGVSERMKLVTFSAGGDSERP